MSAEEEEKKVESDTKIKNRDPYPWEVEVDEEKNHELTKYPDIAPKLREIRRLHLESCHYEALDIMKELEAYIKSKNDDKLLKLFYKHPRIITIMTQIEAADKMMNLLKADDDEWKLIKDDGKWTTEYKQQKGTVYHSFRLKGIGKVKLINILAIFYEMDLISHWMPLSKESYQIKQLALYCKCGFVRIGAFWPIKDRECIIFGFGIDDLKRNDMCLVCFDTNKEPHKKMLKKFNIKLPKIEKGRVRIDINIGGFLLEKVKNDPEKTKLSVVWNVDPKISVPPSILNWFTGQFAGIFLSQIVKTANNINKDTEYAKRFAENEEFYGAMRKKLAVNTNDANDANDAK